MKILFVSTVHPSKKSGANTYVTNLIDHMTEGKEIELFWIICERNKIVTKKSEKIYDIREFSNAKDILDKIKPDVVLAINNKFDPIQCAISIASKFKKIPLVHFKVIEKEEEGEVSSNIEMQKISRNFQRLRSSNVNSKKKIFNHVLFIMYKHNFLNNTRSKIGINIFKNIQLFFNDVTSYFQQKQRMYKIADLQLVNNLSWYNLFINLGFDKEKLALTGSPYWDPIFKKIEKYNLNNNYDHKKIRILIITSPLVEHGYGTYNERDIFFKKIFEELNNDNIEFALKIHPSSEKRDSYKKLLKNNNLKNLIIQDEKLWDIIDKYDVVLTYGYGYPQIECAFGGIRTILLKTEWEFPELDIVKSAKKAGYFLVSKDFKKIKSMIEELINKKVEINKEIIKERENLCFRFDGKSSERAKNAIFNLLDEKKVNFDKF